MTLEEQPRQGDEFELFRQVGGPYLADRKRQTVPKWNALMTAAEEHQIAPGVVYGATLDGAAGIFSSEPYYPYQRVALVVDRAEGLSENSRRDFVVGELESLEGELEQRRKIGLLTDGEIANALEVLRLLRKVVYPEYF